MLKISQHVSNTKIRVYNPLLMKREINMDIDSESTKYRTHPYFKMQISSALQELKKNCTQSSS